MIVTIGTGKGGAGKTTTSVGLASYWAEVAGKEVLLVDLDPQDAGSAAWWLDLANPGSMAWTSATGPQLAAAIGNVSHDIIVIDTPPRLTEGDKDLIAAAQISDLVVVVTEPSALDVASAAQTIALIKNRAPYTVCLTKVDPRSLAESHRAQLELVAQGHSVAPTAIRRYASVRRAAPNLLPTDLTDRQGRSHIADIAGLANHIEHTLERKHS